MRCSTGMMCPLDKYLDADLVSHWLGDRTLHGLPVWRDAMAGFFAAFPDASYTLEDVFFAGDKGVWRGTWRATQRGNTCCGHPTIIAVPLPNRATATIGDIA